MSANCVAPRALLPVLLLAIVVGCTREPPLAETPPPEVVVCKPASETIEDRDIYTGTVESKEVLKVTSRVRGHIKDVVFTEGDEIAAGQSLFIIDSDPFQADLKQAQGQLAMWDAKLKLADERIAIYKPLADKGTVSKEELLQALAAKGEAIGNIETARGKILETQLNIRYCKITSPIAGRIGEALITKGNLVNSSGAETLATVVEVDPMYVKFNVNENAVRNYQRMLREQSVKKPDGSPDTKPNIPVELALVGDAGFSYKGAVDFVDNRIDPGTSSVKVRARFTNPKGTDGRRALTAGSFARVRVSISKPHPALLVADRAILTDQSLKYVLVVNRAKNNLVERVDVVASDRLQESGLKAVEAGLKGDEWVIVEGVNRARPGITVNPTDGKMPRRPAVGK